MQGRGSDVVFPLPPEVERVIELLQDRKAIDVVVLKLLGISSATDYFVLASGSSDIHVRSISEHVRDGMKRDGTRADHVEGLDRARWVLLDYIDFVVHVLHPSAREFYQLETLWGDAPRMDFDD